MADFWTSLVGGFHDAKAQREKENLAESHAAAQREGQILSALMQADDPETGPQVRALAIAGLLDSANPRKRKGGLRGWLGELEQSPYLPQIRALLSTPAFSQNPAVGDLPPGVDPRGATLPSRQSIQGVATPAVQPSITEAPATDGTAAAMPATAPVAPAGSPTAGPPPTPTQYTQAPPQPYTIARPRQIFADPIDRMAREAFAKGEINEEVELRSIARLFNGDMTKAIEFRRREREAEIQHRLGRGSAGMRYGEGEITPDSTSPTGFSRRMYLLSDPRQFYTEPAMDPSKSSTRFFGQDLESISQSAEFGGRAFAAQPPEVKQQIITKRDQMAVTQAGSLTTARETAQANAPLTRQQTFAAHQTLTTDWQELSKPLREIQRQMAVMDNGMAQARAAAASGGSVAPGAGAVTLTFQKILDPISVVRTEEYLRIAGEQGLLDRAKGVLERMVKGGTGVPIAELEQYVGLAHQIATAMDHGMQIDRTRIARTARTYGLDPSLILDRVPPESTAPPSPTANPGAVAAPSGPPPTPTSTSSPTTGGVQIGDPVIYQGKRYKVVGITNGQADLEPVP